MLQWVLTRHIDGTPFLALVYTISAALGIYLLLKSPLPKMLVRTGIAAVVGAGLGVLTCWLVGDVWDAFGIDLTLLTRLWVALAFAGVAVAVVNLTRSRWWRVVIAAVSIPVFVLMGAVGVNVDFGAYPTLADAFGIGHYRLIGPARLHGHATDEHADLLASWRPKGTLRSTGTVGTVHIPATVSHFRARNASVYLPPAALVSNAPALPVIVAMSGQPGKPADMFAAGDIPAILNRYAAAHHGLAPIVVVPDQLGAPGNNPMCVDSPLGNSATYLTVDVPRWIRSHLKVSTSTRDWAVAGFSQGGTCSIQFGAGKPSLFPNILDISGEVSPTIGADTVAKGFHGSLAAYDAAKPLTLLAEHAPYQHSMAIFGVGADDEKYVPEVHTVEKAAKAAGMRTTLIVSPGTAHDWHTVRYVLSRALPELANHLLGVS